MKITHCKLSKKYRHKLLEYCLSEATDRSAAILPGIQPNTGALFYRKIREVIAAHWDCFAEEMFGGEIELDAPYFYEMRKRHYAPYC